MDVFCVAVIAFVIALGTIRDLVLGRFPIGWTQHPDYIYLVIAAGLMTIVIARYINHLKRLFLVLDAMGYATVVVVMSGMITGIGERILDGETRIELEGGATLIIPPPAASASASADW